MIKKIIFTLGLTPLLFSATINPLPLSFRSIDTGGNMDTLTSYQDGIGVVVTSFQNMDDLRVNNALEQLVYKYGLDARSNNISVAEQVLTATTNAPSQDVFYANILKNNVASSIAQNNCESGFIGDANSPANVICGGYGFTYLSSGYKSLNVAIDLDISNNSLVSLTNLDGLTDVLYTLNISGNPLSTIDGLSSLKSVSNIIMGDRIGQAQPSTIRGLNSFSKLTTVSGTISIQNLPKLESLIGLNNLTNVPNGFFSIKNTPLLSDISALSNLQNVYSLSITGTAISNVNSLSSLTTVSNGLALYNNSELSNLSGLNHITNPNGNIFVDNKIYTTKISASSVICQNWGIFDSNGVAVSKTKVCN